MIHARVLAQYLGCSPISQCPAALLLVEVRHDLLLGLFRKSVLQRLRELLRELPDHDVLLGSLKSPAEGHEVKPEADLGQTSTQGQSSSESSLVTGGDTEPLYDIESWLLRWVDALQVRAGMLKFEKPRTLPSATAAEDEPDSGSLKLRIVVDLGGGSLQQLLTALAWSGMLWEWALTDGARQLRRELLQSAPTSHPRPKASLLAMGRSAMERGFDWHVENLFADTPMLVIGRGRGLRRVSQKVTDRTTGWGMHFSKQKMLATRLLAEAGLPVAAGSVVATLRHAVELADRLGYPVVTKPANLDQGKGVVTAIQNREQLLKAFRRSEAAGSPVLIESHVGGKDFRFYLVNGRLLAALERIPAQVCGDGNSTVRQLVEVENRHRSKHPVNVEGGQRIYFTPIKLDPEAKHMLMSQHLTPECVPAEGKFVRLSPTANFSMGGTVRECLADVHPDNRRLLEKAAGLFRLDIAGIDVIAPSMDIPLRLSGGVICEVNGMPGVLPHQLAEPERDLMAEALTILLEDLDRPPLVVVQGGDDVLPIIAAIERDLAPFFPQLAVVDRHGWRQGGVLWSSDDTRSFSGQRRALRDPDSDAFLMELNPESVMRHGLPWIKADVLMLLDGGGSSLLAGWDRWLATHAKLVVATPSRSRHLPAQVRVVPIIEASTASSLVIDQLRTLGMI